MNEEEYIAKIDRLKDEKATRRLHPRAEHQIKKTLKGINVPEEYELIQRKQSNLSANMRRLVVRYYNYIYGTTT